LSLFFGIIAAALVLIFGISAAGGGLSLSGLGTFLNFPGLIITVLGTFAALAASHPFSLICKIPSHFRVIARESPDPLYYINMMTDLSRQARRKGLLALDDALGEGYFDDDEFLRSSVMMVVDAMAPGKVREALETELANLDARHAAQAAIYDKGAALAPGFGIIGTVTGLITMLGAMDFTNAGGASTLAGGMTAALISTLYGILLANLVFIPIASQLRAAHEQEILCKEIVAEGIISIQAGENPRNTHERLLTYLTYGQRWYLREGSSYEGE